MLHKRHSYLTLIVQGQKNTPTAGVSDRIRTSRFKEPVGAMIFIHRKPRLHIIGHCQNTIVHAAVPTSFVVPRYSACSQCGS